MTYALGIMLVLNIFLARVIAVLCAVSDDELRGWGQRTLASAAATLILFGVFVLGSFYAVEVLGREPTLSAQVTESK